MNKNIIYITFIGLFGFLLSCQKDETKVVMSSNPVAPTFKSFPDLLLSRANSGDTLVFKGTAVDPGFQASATYFLEADTAGNEFKNAIVLTSGIQDSVMKITVNDFDFPLIQRFPIAVLSSLEFRIRAVITPDAGTGANTPIVSNGAPTSLDVKLYGPPTLGLTPDGHRQGITSPTDNKLYTGFIYSDGTTAFKLTNLDNGKVYGGTVTISGTSKVIGNGVLTEGGPAITLPTGGYNLSADLTDLANIKLTLEDKTLCIIGDAASGWGTDIRMVWNFSDKTWNYTITLVPGGLKFRTYGDWGNGFNLGYNTTPSLDNLLNASTSGNITGFVGKYNIKLYTLTTPAKVVLTPVSN
jgi:starch-binding outer membrane protein SusE/F